MAIQSRRGPYNKFDTQKMLPGEWAVVLEGDTNAVDGMAVYMCFKAGVVKRMATYEDMVDNIRESSGEIIAAQIETAVRGAVEACETAASEANTSKTNADTATKNANAATTAANKSKADADAAAQRANEAAEACEGIKDNTRITALENEMAQMSIGGTNLLHKTRDMSGYGTSSNVTLSKDSEGFTVASFASVSTLAWNSVRVIPIQFSAVRGKTVTASLEVRSADYVQLNAEQKQGLNISFNLCGASSLVRAKYKAIAKYTEDLSEDWKKITVTATLSDEFFSEGTGTIDDTTRFFLQVYNYSVYRMEIRKIKLEVGTKATDWSPAPEDTDAAIAAVDSKFASYSTTTEMNTAIDNKVADVEEEISGLNDKIVQIAYFTSDKFSITANTTGNIRIPITGLDGKKIIGGVVQVTGGIPFEVSLNSISSTTSQIFYRGAVDANDRTVRLYVFYM